MESFVLKAGMLQDIALTMRKNRITRLTIEDVAIELSHEFEPTQIEHDQAPVGLDHDADTYAHTGVVPINLRALRKST